MGTLSGGGTEVIRIGQRCLVGRKVHTAAFRNHQRVVTGLGQVGEEISHLGCCSQFTYGVVSHCGGLLVWVADGCSTSM
jgi:hypothetical protein